MDGKYVFETDSAAVGITLRCGAGRSAAPRPRQRTVVGSHAPAACGMGLTSVGYVAARVGCRGSPQGGEQLHLPCRAPAAGVPRLSSHRQAHPRPPPTPPCPPAPCSVLFFSSLVLVGFGLPKFVKQPLGAAAAKAKGCFRRRPAPPKLQPPAPAPAAEAVAQPEGEQAAQPASS